MATHKLEQPLWKDFFDRATKILIGTQTEIEVASLSMGAQIEAEWLPLLGISYDPKDDVIEIALGDDVDHLIQRPREVHIDTGPGGLTSIEIVDAGDVRQIIKLRDPLMLPPPEGRQKATAGEHR